MHNGKNENEIDNNFEFTLHFDKRNLLFIFGHYRGYIIHSTIRRGIVIKNYIKGNTTSSLRFVERWNSTDIKN